MKKSAYLREENLLTLISLHDFIVPEIQREYVWGSNDNKEIVLRPFLESIKNEAKPNGHCHYAHSTENLHIGFLYSYKPQYIKDESSRISDEYLIDGQQRFTTLFLLLLTRAVVENRLQDFNNLIRWEDGGVAFDYKVRELTHLFLYDLINAVQSNGQETLKNLSNDTYPNWFMQDYRDDTTVTSMIGAIKCINEVFNDANEYYYDYLLTRIRFWHFKTDVTSQGEELYITMNSRGEGLSNNEVEKARKLKGLDQKNWGHKWEEWQQYFWKNRKKGEAKNFDADKGFNNLLSCIESMCLSLELKDCGTIEFINESIETLQYIVDSNWREQLINDYQDYYTEWIPSFIKLVWTRINTTSAKWLIETESDTTQRENAVLLWPMFYYCHECKKQQKEPNSAVFIRLMHLCYLNYKAKKTNHASIKDFIDELVNCDNNPYCFAFMNNRFLSDEQKEIAEILLKETEATKLESIIWAVQDKTYFLDAEDVGGDTIIDYINIFNSHSMNLFDAISDLIKNYDVLFPAVEAIMQVQEVLLKRILLFYKDSKNNPFWKQVSPYYDNNYETSSWKRIIRHGAFLNFYDEITQKLGKGMIIQISDIEELLKNKQKAFFADSRNNTFDGSIEWSDRRLAILFDFVTDGKLWNSEERKDLVFYFREPYIGKPFLKNRTIWNRTCGRKFTWVPIKLPNDWEMIIKTKVPCL